MVNVRPMAPFTYLYPFEREQLMEIAYYFDFDYEDDRSDDAYAQETIGLVRAWMADSARGGLELRQNGEDAIEILDTRRELAGAPLRAALLGWKAAVYLECDRAQTLQNLSQLPALVLESVTEEELHAFLDRCVEHGLMVHNGRSWLGVAVHVPAREAPSDTSLPVSAQSTPLGAIGLTPVLNSAAAPRSRA